MFGYAILFFFFKHDVSSPENIEDTEITVVGFEWCLYNSEELLVVSVTVLE